MSQGRRNRTIVTDPLYSVNCGDRRYQGLDLAASLRALALRALSSTTGDSRV